MLLSLNQSLAKYTTNKTLITVYFVASTTKLYLLVSFSVVLLSVFMVQGLPPSKIGLLLVLVFVVKLITVLLADRE